MAIDIPSNRILWRSQPLVNNAGNFVIKDDAIIAGYTFSGEKDCLSCFSSLPLLPGASSCAVRSLFGWALYDETS
jgi:hypothetical protein